MEQTTGQPGPTGRDVDLAVAESVRALAPRVDADWQVPAGTLEWSCATTAAHISHDLVAYAGQLTARPADSYLPFDLRVHPGTAPGELLAVLRACGGMLSSALDAADPADRAWHWGPTDPTGFAAMGVAEILLHTHDIAQGLRIDWRPPADLCAKVLTRLFPAAPPGDPAEVLLWSTGRGRLGDREPLTSWVWKAAAR
ncbi:maleylpyruvate isomerase N-terminal domain-containing protein [Kitasatospora sp. GAS1066B]|uniref:maleylpyruvate isomerase N-terminal domain-containing protein n=1 Tax=Kitasatospora sp. GAS1066B TaxID=3156271 RepID=UPI0035135FA3